MQLKNFLGLTLAGVVLGGCKSPKQPSLYLTSQSAGDRSPPSASAPAKAETKAASGIAERPEQLKFPPLDYEPPAADKYRVQLKSGPVAYVVPDRELPLVSVNVLVHSGEYVQPEGKEGVSELTGYLLARGGTKSKKAEELEERLAFLAARLDSGVEIGRAHV